MSSPLATEQQLYRTINPQPISSIRDLQCLSGLVSGESHLDNAMDGLSRSVLIRWGIEDIDLRRMLMEHRVGNLSR